MQCTDVCKNSGKNSGKPVDAVGIQEDWETSRKVWMSAGKTALGEGDQSLNPLVSQQTPIRNYKNKQEETVAGHQRGGTAYRPKWMDYREITAMNIDNKSRDPEM